MTVKTLTKESIPIAYPILGAIALFGAALAIVRLTQGLGATTNLSNYYPWGLWITFDLSVIPFSGGAFTLAGVVYILNRKDYRGIAHLALLAGFLGYIMAVLVLLLDINRWDQFYNVILPWRWNLHSFMLEVSLSITLYFGVMTLELVPIVFGRRNWRVVRAIDQFVPLIAGVGVLLSTIHQGSLGGLFLLMSRKLHPLWWSPIIHLFFFISAVVGGLSAAILIAILSWHALHKRVPIWLLSVLAKVIATVMALYLVLKLGDLLVAGKLGLVFGSGVYSLLYLVELSVGVLVPLAIFASRARDTEKGLLAGATCAVVGLLLNRAAITWFALRATPGATYFPSWIEISIIVSAICAGVLFFALGLHYLPTIRASVEEGR